VCVKTSEITCPRCGTSHIKKNGTTRQGKERYRCKECGKGFLFCLHYTYRACSALWRDLIVPMTLNTSGCVTLPVCCKSAQLPCWLYCAPRRPKLANRVCHRASRNWKSMNNGRLSSDDARIRTDKSCRHLCQKLASCRVQEFYTHQWKSYTKCLDPQFHFIGKTGTQNIERKNLNFRTHLKRLQRRTICFSKSPDMHRNVLKLYIHALNSKQHHF
jgi:insertion element IS1 protein InsB